MGFIFEPILMLMSQNTPQKIFISHVTPTDNYFTAWLSSKLKLLGYDVWVELDELKGGDAFWPEIENAIRNLAVKFLVVVSNSYVEKVKDSVSGVFKELSCADRIRNVKNFKTPIKIDATNEDDYPVQIMGLNAINFHENWQNGLDKLLEGFEKEKIPRNEILTSNPLNFWLDAFKIDELVNSNSETIYTNWFPFTLPLKLYIHKPNIHHRVDLIDLPYSYIEYSDRHLAFFPQGDYPPSIQCASSVELTIQEILDQQLVPIDDFLTLSEPRKKIVQLVNKTVQDFFVQAKMKKHQQANTSVYYFPSNDINRKRISLKEVGKNNVAISGKNKGNYWSFGISTYAILYPTSYLKLNSHIIFENSEQVVYGPDEHHALRRKFAFDWYNKDWLDTLLGMTFKLSNGNETKHILIPVSSSENLIVDAVPYSMVTNFGYQEPVKLDKDEE